MPTAMIGMWQGWQRPKESVVEGKGFVSMGEMGKWGGNDVEER